MKGSMMSSYIPSTASHFTKGGEGREVTTEKIKRKNSRLSYILSSTSFSLENLRKNDFSSFS